MSFSSFADCKLICGLFASRMMNSLPEMISAMPINFELGTMESSCWPFSVSPSHGNILIASVNRAGARIINLV